MGIVPDGPRRARPTRALPRPKAIAAAVGVAAAVLGATAWATLAGGAGAQGSWSSLIGFGFYQLWMATLAAWAQAIAFTAAVGGGMLALAGRRQQGGALVLAISPWLVVASSHASRPADRVLGRVLWFVIAASLVGVGCFHQSRNSRARTSRPG